MDGRDVAGVVAAHLPGYEVHTVGRLGAGQDNIAFEVNGELVVRFGKDPDPDRVAREARLLAAVAAISPLPVPEPVFTAPARGCLAYRKLPGRPLLEVPVGPAHTRAIAAALGGLLAALHAAPFHFVGTDNQPLAEWRREAAQCHAAVADRVPAIHRPAVAAFLETAPPDGGYGLAFTHNDLGIEHVLIDPDTWTVTGVIDWGDAAMADPASDFGLIYRDLGPAALDAALHGYGIEVPGLRERAVFYARCSVFEDLAYGIETGHDRYVDKSVAALSWLFPA